MTLGIATVGSFFSPSSVIGGAVRIYSRLCPFPSPSCLTLVRLDELESAMQDEQFSRNLEALLSPEEKELFASYSFPKRRKEWLGGRLAAKWAVLGLSRIKGTEETMPELSVLPVEKGWPRLITSLLDASKIPALSISHSDRFAVAMAADATACGIDIQKITDKTERVADRFSDEKEAGLLQEFLPRLEQKERLTLLWSAKEALKKALLQDQPVMFQGVVLDSVELREYISLRLRFPGDRNHPAEIIAVRMEDCFLAYSVVHPCHA